MIPLFGVASSRPYKIAKTLIISGLAIFILEFSRDFPVIIQDMPFWEGADTPPDKH